MLANETYQAKGWCVAPVASQSAFAFRIGQFLAHGFARRRSQCVFVGTRCTQFQCTLGVDNFFDGWKVRVLVCQAVLVANMNDPFSLVSLFFFYNRTASFGNERRADLRGGSVSTPSGDLRTPRTGLSMLMNGGGQMMNPSTPSAASFASLSGMSNDFISPYQEERERQASALAAAGMVAESVTLSGGRAGLAAPPQLPSAAPASTGEMDTVNWGSIDAAGILIDDMDLDFATLFDPSIEEANMQTEGSGWPVSSNNGGAPTPAGS